MTKDEFWSVELGNRMGPLVLGTEYEALLQVLRDRNIDADRLRLERSGKLTLPEIGIALYFSQTRPQTLRRIDVDDERLRFGSLSVIGKRAHEIVGIFKVPRKETLWHSIEDEDEIRGGVANGNTAEQSRQLLASGTIWITSLGLGLKLGDGLVSKIHLCEPSQSPRSGNGRWTKEQQMLSEVRELPVTSTSTSTPHKDFSFKSILVAMVHLALIASIGTLIWWAVQLQRRWDAATEVPAVVVALEPSSPKVLPLEITVSFTDSSGAQRRHTLGYTQFDTTPNLGDECTIRYLPDSPGMVLGASQYRSVGFDRAIPYGIGILAIYSFLQLIVLAAFPYRKTRSN